MLLGLPALRNPGASLTAAWAEMQRLQLELLTIANPRVMSCLGFVPATIAVGQKPNNPPRHGKRVPSASETWTVTEPKSNSIILRTTARMAMSTTIRTWIAPVRWASATKIE